MRLTFASYNIHKAVGLDRRRDPDRIIAVLRELHADVIALQECDRRFGERESVLPKALLDDTPWRPAEVTRRPRSLGWHGNALLVRRDIEIVEAEPIHLPMLEPRGAVRADLLLAGRRLRVLGMHLDLSGLRRKDQVGAVLRHCGDCGPACPTVMMGDFNQWGAGKHALQCGVTHHCGGVGERRVGPAVIANVEKAAEVVNKLARGFRREVLRARSLRVDVGGALEGGHAPRHEQVLPCRLCRNPDDLGNLTQSIARPRRARLRVL